MVKKKGIKTLCAIVVMAFCGFNAQAQLSHLETSFYMGGNLPVGEFAADVQNEQVPMTKENIGSDAMIGVSFGARLSYNFDIGFGELSPLLHIDFKWNTMRGAHRDAFSTLSCKSSSSFNIPVFVGLNYRYPVTEIVKPFVEFGIGPDILFTSKEGGGKYSNGVAIPTLRYKPSTAFAWQIGGGTFLGEYVSFSLHYTWLGKHTMEYTKGTAKNIAGTLLEDNNMRWKKMSVLSLSVGFHF